ECLSVFAQNFRRIALRIDGNEQYLQVITVFAEQGLNLGSIHQGRRADVGALGKTEEHHDHLAFEVFQGPYPAVGIFQAETVTEASAREIYAVNVLKTGFLLATSGEGEGQNCGTERRQKGSAGGGKA